MSEVDRGDQAPPEPARVEFNQGENDDTYALVDCDDPEGSILVEPHSGELDCYKPPREEDAPGVLHLARAEALALAPLLESFGRTGGLEAARDGEPSPGRIGQLEELIRHCWVHSGYRGCGFMEMTTEQKRLYCEVVGDHFESRVEAHRILDAPPAPAPALTDAEREELRRLLDAYQQELWSSSRAKMDRAFVSLTNWLLDHAEALLAAAEEAARLRAALETTKAVLHVALNDLMKWRQFARYNALGLLCGEPGTLPDPPQRPTIAGAEETEWAVKEVMRGIRLASNALAQPTPAPGEAGGRWEG